MDTSLRRQWWPLLFIIIIARPVAFHIVFSTSLDLMPLNNTTCMHRKSHPKTIEYRLSQLCICWNYQPAWIILVSTLWIFHVAFGSSTYLAFFHAYAFHHDMNASNMNKMPVEYDECKSKRAPRVLFYIYPHSKIPRTQVEILERKKRKKKRENSIFGSVSYTQREMGYIYIQIIRIPQDILNLTQRL